MVSLELSNYDLYAINGRIETFTKDRVGVTAILTRMPVTYTPQAGDNWHTLKQGEDLDFIVWRYYGATAGTDTAAYYWGVIADANSIHDPQDIAAYVGRLLLIPNFQRVILGQ